MWTYYILGIVMIPGILFAAVASWKVQSTFNKYNQTPARSGISASRMAREILNREGLYDIQIVKVRGNLSDYYDHRNKKLALSESVYSSTSVGALGVAAHECGHAIQYARNYMPVKLRSALVPVVNFSSAMLWPILIAALVFGFVDIDTGIGMIMMWVAVALFGVSILFSLVTLPTELNASRRANKILTDIGALNRDESAGAKKVLNAAAMTYVASLVMSILSLVRILLVFFLHSKRRK